MQTLGTILGAILSSMCQPFPSGTSVDCVSKAQKIKTIPARRDLPALLRDVNRLSAGSVYFLFRPLPRIRTGKHHNDVYSVFHLDSHPAMRFRTSSGRNILHRPGIISHSKSPITLVASFKRSLQHNMPKYTINSHRCSNSCA